MKSKLDEKEEIMRETISKMDEKQKVDFLTEVYFRSMGIFFLIEFLERKGIIEKGEYQKFVKEEMEKI